MAIQFTEEQIALKELAHEFFEKEVRPVMAQIDARPNPKECYPRELVRKGSEIGLRTLALPEEYDGAGADMVTQNLVLTTMAETEAGLGKLFSQCWKVTRAIAQSGTEEQKKKFLVPFAKDHDFVCSMCSTEPNSGSDNAAPYNPPPRQGIMTTAMPDGDYYVIKGSKQLISLGSFSKLLFVVTRTSPDLPARQGLTIFLVPGDHPGVSYGQVHNKWGWRLYPNAEIFFDNVRVPKDHMLGELNKAPEVQAKMNRGDIETPACLLGISKAMYRICLEHARQRVQGGKIIIEHPTVGSMLSEMAMLIDVMEAYLFDLVVRTQLPNWDRKITRFGRIFFRETMLRMVAPALDIMASAGIMRDNGLEKLIRDGLTLFHGSGTNSLLKARIVPWLK